MMKGVKSSFSLSGQHPFHSLSIPSLHSDSPWHPMPLPLCLLPPEAPRHQWPRPLRKRHAHVGQSHALEHQSTVARPSRGLPQALGRGMMSPEVASTSTVCQRAGPLLPLSLSSFAARARRRPARPMHGLARASAKPLPLLSSLSLAP